MKWVVYLLSEADERKQINELPIFAAGFSACTLLQLWRIRSQSFAGGIKGANIQECSVAGQPGILPLAGEKEF